MKISLIVAVGNQNQIGLNNKLLWSLKDDMKNFKQLTNGHCILMGKNTFLSIGKPLPNRINIVVSHNKIEDDDKIIVKHSIEDAIDYAKKTGENELFIIGGAMIYNYFIQNDLANYIYLTRVDYNGEADTFFPQLDMLKWNIIESNRYQKNDKNQYNFTIEKLEKID